MLGYSTGKTRLVKLGYTNSSTSQRHCGCLLGKEQNWQSFSSAPAALDVPTLYCTLYGKAGRPAIVAVYDDGAELLVQADVAEFTAFEGQLDMFDSKQY